MGAFRLYEPHELGRDGYPPEWHETIKHAVREEAGHRCVRCGHPFVVGESRGEWSPCDEQCTHLGPIRWQPVDQAGIGDRCGWNISETVLALPDVATWRVEARHRVLTVHHLDGVKANCRWWNLAALCQRCHLTIQGKVRMERTWPWEHSEWFKPYVAGFYAFAYLGEDLSRGETLVRLDELLALEQMTAEDASGREWREFPQVAGA